MTALVHAPPQRRPTAECRPPDDTPIGAVGYLSNGAVEIPFRWNGRRWESVFIDSRSQTPSALARRGWALRRIETAS